MYKLTWSNTGPVGWFLSKNTIWFFNSFVFINDYFSKLKILVLTASVVAGKAKSLSLSGFFSIHSFTNFPLISSFEIEVN